MNEVILLLQQAVTREPHTTKNGFSFEIRKGEHWLIAGESEALKNGLLDALSGQPSSIHGLLTFPFFEEYKNTHTSTDPLFSPFRLMAYISSRHHFKNLSNTHQFYYQQRFSSSDSEQSLTVHEYLSGVITNDLQGTFALNDIVSKLALHHLLNLQLIKLSNGETKRVLIASALLKQPVVMLLSNPLTGLDAASRSEIMELIDYVAATGITIIMTETTGELPRAITNVATITNQQFITGSIKDYQGKDAQATTATGIDEAEIFSLINRGSKPTFKVVIAMKDVRIRYGERTILNNINWTVQQGEQWVVTGPNGAGKSTLLSLINGDNPQAFANNIILFDRQKGSGESIWDIKKNIGFFSPELYQYFPLETSCLQAVESGLYDTIGLFKPSTKEQANLAMRWLKLLNVDHLAYKTLNQLSAAEQRLCLLARAFIKSPPLLILDEPCQGLNEYQKNNVKQIINCICMHSNTTLLYVSHYKHEIPECVKHELALSNGIIVSCN